MVAVRAAATAVQITTRTTSLLTARGSPSDAFRVGTSASLSPERRLYSVPEARTGDGYLMVKKTDRDSVIEHALGSLGLFLVPTKNSIRIVKTVAILSAMLPASLAVESRSGLDFHS
jgi:hypothetical protein